MRGSTIVVALCLGLVGCPMIVSVGSVGTTTDATSTGSSGGEVPTSGAAPTNSTSGSTSGVSVTTGDGTTVAVVSTGGDSSSGEAGTSTGTSEATSTGEATTGAPPRWFDCYGCLCDADEFYCQQVFAGFAGPMQEACPVVVADSLDSGCVAYPRGCADPASCDCLPHMNGACFCTEVEAGVFEVVCPLP